MAISKGSTEIILSVTDLASGGAGVAREPSGRVVFVPFSAPGDVIRVRMTKESKSYAWAEIIEILNPSPVRVTPPCAVFGQCGGCQWQHLPYILQWETKLRGALLSLKRANVENLPEISQFPAERIWEYRNRVQLRGERNQLGFFQAKSQTLVPANRCEISDPLINQTWEETRELGESKASFFKVEVEVTEDHQIIRHWNQPHSAAGFRQVHNEQNEKMRSWIKEALKSGKILLDLFGGSGNFSHSLTSHFEEIHCVDVGIHQGKKKEPTDQTIYHRSTVLNFLSREIKSKKKWENSSAILDPPRIGLGRDRNLIARAVEHLAIQEIVLVGCNQDAWAKDLAELISHRFHLTKLAFFDLFPQTHHVESIAFLQRTD